MLVSEMDFKCQLNPSLSVDITTDPQDPAGEFLVDGTYLTLPEINNFVKTLQDDLRYERMRNMNFKCVKENLMRQIDEEKKRGDKVDESYREAEKIIEGLRKEVSDVSHAPIINGEKSFFVAGQYRTPSQVNQMLQDKPKTAIWRCLEPDDIIKEGDQYRVTYSDVWIVAEIGLWGNKVGNSSLVYRRRVEVTL